MKKILAYLMVGIAFTGCNSLDLEPISSIADNEILADRSTGGCF